MAQNPKLKNINSINVGVKHDMLVNIMFTTAKEEYFYAIIKDVKIKKAGISRIEAKIRKADSVCVEVMVKTASAKQTQRLFKLVSREFGKPESKVLKTPTTYDWVWQEKQYPRYIESKSFQYIDLNVLIQHHFLLN